jgi:hypothetical protein
MGDALVIALYNVCNFPCIRDCVSSIVAVVIFETFGLLRDGLRKPLGVLGHGFHWRHKDIGRTWSTGQAIQS